jgi:GH15 family glucan-1,4-alpha-glucosidase
MSRSRGGSEPQPQTLRDYAMVADGERGILVGPHGDFAWLCFPRWDSEAVFSSLIGGRGSYCVTPRGRYVWGGHYEPASLIWRSRWTTTTQTVTECHEALAMPGSPDKAVILRRIVAVAGASQVRVELGPSAGFGSQPLRRLVRDEQDIWRGQTGELHIAWSGGGRANPRADGRGGHVLELELDLREGDHHDLVLVIGTAEQVACVPDAEEAWEATRAAWQRRVPGLEGAIAQRDARHAYAVLIGMTGHNGGMVAAATTSLPERAGDGRNYDYRYVWIRDQSYAGQAAARAGPHALLDDAVRFVRDRLVEHGPRMRPAYTVDGGEVPGERRLNLPGYPGGEDKVGNRVNDQFQLDAFGEALLLFAAAADHDRLDGESWHACELAAETIRERWREPDAGIWELEPDLWTHSRLICAAGLRRISSHAHGEEQAVRWLSLADRLVAEAGAHCVHPSGYWQRAPADARVDAALLLAAIRGATRAEDPRALATLRAVERDLTDDGYCFRYRHDQRPLGEAEGAFLLCGYMMVLALEQQGEHAAAARWFERTRAACGPPGLFSEEYDVTQRQLRGNLPQAFVHALLLECAVAAQSSTRGSTGAEARGR